MISKTKVKHEKRARRHKRIRGRIFGTSTRPRLCVYRSNNHLSAQIIDDEKGITLVSSSDASIKGKETPLQKAEEIGKDIALKAKAKKIKSVVFDRGGFIYTGRMKVLAEAARKEGLLF